MNRPIDLYLISGFFGAGKTTLLKHLLAEARERRVGVIVNEFAGVRVDGRLIRRDGVKLAEIGGGDLFSDPVRGGFVRTLAAFLEQPVDVLFVEASALTDPGGMEAALGQMEPYYARKPELSRRYRWRGSVCLVDAAHFLPARKAYPSVERQVRQSRFLVLNKSGGAGEKKRAELMRELRALHPAAEIVQSADGKVPLRLLEEQLRPVREAAEEGAAWNRPVTYILTMPAVESTEQVKEFCRCISHFTLRIKGFFPLEGGFGQVDCVGNDLAVRKLPVGKTPPDCRMVLVGKNRFRIRDELELAWQSAMDGTIAIEEE